MVGALAALAVVGAPAQLGTVRWSGKLSLLGRPGFFLLFSASASTASMAKGLKLDAASERSDPSTASNVFENASSA